MINSELQFSLALPGVKIEQCWNDCFKGNDFCHSLYRRRQVINSGHIDTPVTP